MIRVGCGRSRLRGADRSGNISRRKRNQCHLEMTLGFVIIPGFGLLMNIANIH
jgi:hypothetical protein